MIKLLLSTSVFFRFLLCDTVYLSDHRSYSLYSATLITSSASTCITSSRIWREEAFGPVLAIVAFDTEAEAIALANDSEFGLGELELPNLG